MKKLSFKEFMNAYDLCEFVNANEIDLIAVNTKGGMFIAFFRGEIESPKQVEIKTPFVALFNVDKKT